MHKSSHPKLESQSNLTWSLNLNKPLVNEKLLDHFDPGFDAETGFVWQVSITICDFDRILC